jgi:hypothetical protein
MSDIIIKFPASKRKLSYHEEQELRICLNFINQVYTDRNPFMSDDQKRNQAELIMRDFLKRIFEMNEE